MIKIKMLLSIVMLLQDANTAKASVPLPWWQVVTGILGIPAAILGLVYVFWQIQKTRGEAKKLGTGTQKANEPEDAKSSQSGTMTAFVANEATISNAEVDDIVGIDIEGPGRVPRLNQNAKVFEKGKIEGGKVGKIAGIRQRSNKEDSQ